MKSSLTLRLFGIAMLVFLLQAIAPAQAQQIITQWTFDNTLAPSIGVGTASLVGGTTQHSATATDGWRITSFPNQSENSGTAGVSFMVSTEGYHQITLDLFHHASATMSRWAEIQYTLDGGASWQSHSNNGGQLTPPGVNLPFSFDFSAIANAADNPGFGVRILSIFSPVAFNPGVPDQEYEANTAYHRARQEGGNPYSGEGNWRFLNVVFRGTPLNGGNEEPVKLAFTDFNNDNDFIVNTPFSLTIETQDVNDMAAPVATDTQVNLSLSLGSGTLSGNTTGIIPAGASQVTISGILYNLVESGVKITASAEGLQSAETPFMEVLPATYTLSLGVNIPGAGTLTGAGVYLAGQQVNLQAQAAPGFQFLNWTQGGTIVSTQAAYSFAMPAADVQLTANFLLLAGENLIYYWHFNNLPEEVLTSVAADFPATSQAAITYPGTGDGFMDRASPGSALNSYLGEPEGYALRVRNPSHTRELILQASSEGYQNLYLTFAVQRTSNGAQQQELYFSANAGQSWTQVGGAYSITEEFRVKSFDLTGLPAVNDNADLMFRILFTGSNASGTSGNNRFDNISLSGEPLEPQPAEYALTLEPFPLQAGTVSGGGNYPEGENVLISAQPNTGYTFIAWKKGTEIISEQATFTYTMPAANTTLTAHFVPEPGSPSLVYYWYFDGSLPNNVPLESIAPFFALQEGAMLQYHSALDGYPFEEGHPNWRKASLERRNAPTDINYRPEGNSNQPYQASAMRGIQVKQPFTGDGGENTLIFHLPSLGMTDLVLRFAAMDEGAADAILVDYTLNGTDWITEGLPATNLPLQETFQLFELNFSAIEPANQNPLFSIRLRFEGEDMAADEGTRVTFNNISLDAVLTGEINLPPVVVAPAGLQKGIENGSEILLDMNTIFADPEGQPLSFTAISLKPEFATVQLNGSVLSIAPVRRGDAIIQLTASDGVNVPTGHEFRVLIYPEAFIAHQGGFSFTQWSPLEPEYSYPDHMLFLQSNVNDPGLQTPLLFPYFIPHNDYADEDQGNIGFPYANTRRTRINGLGQQGISMINTGRNRDLGGVLVALNTTSVEGESLRMSWLSGTVLRNSRNYAIRLQYRTSIHDEFQDLLFSGQTWEYAGTTDGHVQDMGVRTLPAQLMNQPYVQLLWRFYLLDGTSGPRAELRLDDILVSSSLGVNSAELPPAQIAIINGKLSITTHFEGKGQVQVINLLGQRFATEVTEGSGTHTFDLQLPAGIYIVVFETPAARISRKIQAF